MTPEKQKLPPRDAELRKARARTRLYDDVSSCWAGLNSKDMIEFEPQRLLDIFISYAIRMLDADADDLLKKGQFSEWPEYLDQLKMVVQRTVGEIIPFPTATLRQPTEEERQWIADRHPRGEWERCILISANASNFGSSLLLHQRSLRNPEWTEGFEKRLKFALIRRTILCWKTKFLKHKRRIKEEDLPPAPDSQALKLERASQKASSANSKRDEKVFKFITQTDRTAFEKLTNQEISKRYASKLRQSGDRELSSLAGNANALKCVLNRIRRHHHYPLSSQIKKVGH